MITTMFWRVVGAAFRAVGYVARRGRTGRPPEWGPSTLDREIALVSEAFERHALRANELEGTTGAVEAFAQAMRTGQWLAVLLRKRGAPGDEARAIAVGGPVPGELSPQ